MNIQRKAEKGKTPYRNEAATGRMFFIQVAFRRSTWSVSHWELTSSLFHYKESKFGCYESISLCDTCVPGGLKKMGCNISKGLSQQVPVQHINK